MGLTLVVQRCMIQVGRYTGQNSIKVGRIGHLEGAGSRGKGFFCALCRLDSQRCSYYVGMRGERGQDGRTPRPTYYLDVNTQLPRAGCCNGLRPPADYHTNVVSTRKCRLRCCGVAISENEVGNLAQDQPRRFAVEHAL